MQCDGTSTPGGKMEDKGGTLEQQGEIDGSRPYEGLVANCLPPS